MTTAHIHSYTYESYVAKLAKLGPGISKLERKELERKDSSNAIEIISRLPVKHARRDAVRLSPYERADLCPDQHLYEGPEAAEALEAVPDMKKELDAQLEGLRTMPERICDQETSTKWDIVLLKAEAAKMTLGIPGETVCFACDLDNKTTQVYVVVSHFQDRNE